ncbi:GNAT family N-acetyltransferase [Pseudonocardia lacus]|uniref:GNAT family N-acetyltransferase n=1 Tax=Pseudonocardia lacus TaxID=2835865 RepID=UPI0020283CEF|nr:GNAT family N-acetyltransferase [Pseudonocardia lacus]
MSVPNDVTIRDGGPGDTPVVLALLDGAVAWLVANGRPGQWGTEPWSSTRERVDRITAMTRTDRIRIAEVDGRPVSALATSPTPPAYVDPADEPELYVTLLVGRGGGAALLADAREQARALGVGLLRVDCYAGDDGRLVDYYRANGFSPVHAFTVGDWPGQVLAQRVWPPTRGPARAWPAGTPRPTCRSGRPAGWTSRRCRAGR